MTTSLKSLRAAAPWATPRTLAVAAAAITALYTLQTLVAGYHAWRAVGPGGVPPSPRGYAVHLAIRLATALQPPLRSPAPYARAQSLYGAAGRAAYLPRALPRREPTATLPWTVPHRQAVGNAPALRERQAAHLRALAATHAAQLELKTSALERHGEALFLRASRPAAPWQLGVGAREIAHFHLAAEGSGHALLAPRDAQTVLERGWGERHGLSGLVLPWGYVLVFAPRDEDEVEIVGAILEAAVGFALAASREAGGE